VLSLNIGSVPGFVQVPGAEQMVMPVKPIGTFVQRWEPLVMRMLAAPDRVCIGVVGAGAGGVELTLAMQFRLQHVLCDAGRPDTVEYYLFRGTWSK
jgi:selenide,water dikinase